MPGRSLRPPFYMNDATRYKGRWRKTFARPGQPLHLELGCGKGGFLARLASRNPDVNYIGVDITDQGTHSCQTQHRTHLRRTGASHRQREDPGSRHRTYSHTVGQSGPRGAHLHQFLQPMEQKANHKKHRLTHTRQLLLYRPFLADGAEIWSNVTTTIFLKIRCAIWPRPGSR